jgi:endonuclease/exonuclease/phosphatase family metal-dependent hydrolase
MKLKLSLFFFCSSFLFSVASQPHYTSVKLQSDTLRILSYNVKMLPRIFPHLQHHPVKRARLIPKHILADSVDIVIFQEMFDAKARHLLTNAHKHELPYMIGPGNLRPKGYKKGSGVLIMSRYPFKFLEKIKYNDCYGTPDCRARKGVILVEVNDGKQTFQIAGTHMQAGGGKELKKKQIEQAAALMKQFRKEGIPQIAGGDFNVRDNDTLLYPKLLRDFESTSGVFSGEQQFTSDHKLNDLYKDRNPNKRNTVDHILYKGNGVEPKYIERVVKIYKERYHKNHEDLSDHYAVLMKLVW